MPYSQSEYPCRRQNCRSWSEASWTGPAPSPAHHLAVSTSSSSRPSREASRQLPWALGYRSDGSRILTSTPRTLPCLTYSRSSWLCNRAGLLLAAAVTQRHGGNAVVVPHLVVDIAVADVAKQVIEHSFLIGRNLGGRIAPSWIVEPLVVRRWRVVEDHEVFVLSGEPRHHAGANGRVLLEAVRHHQLEAARNFLIIAVDDGVAGIDEQIHLAHMGAIAGHVGLDLLNRAI